MGEARVGFFADMAARLPWGRNPTAADVAAAYLCLMESDYTSGETLRIDGGHSLI